MACDEKQDNVESEIESEDSAVEVEEDVAQEIEEDTAEEIEEDIIQEEVEEIESVEGIENSLFYLAPNGVTVVCPKALMGDCGAVNGVTYTKRNRDELLNLVRNEGHAAVEQTCVSGITDMERMFYGSDFNGDISSWDVSNVTNTIEMLAHVAFQGLVR